jgi:integrase
VPVTLSSEEVSQVLAAVPMLRERAAMEIGYAAGLRLNEVLHLKLADIDNQQMILRVDQGKGGGCAGSAGRVGRLRPSAGRLEGPRPGAGGDRQGPPQSLEAEER